MNDINTDILRIGDTYFAVKRIEAKNIDMNEELKDLYSKRHDTHVKQLNNGVVETAMKEWNTQIDHIRSFDGKSSHVITTKNYDKPVMVFREKLILLRVIEYAPHEMTTNFGYILDRQRKAFGIDAIKKFVKYKPGTEDTSQKYNNDTLIIKFKPPFSIPLIVGYDERCDTLYCPMRRTYHTMSDRHQCTGSHTGGDYWRLNDSALAREMSKVNMFSPAQNSMLIGDTTYDLNDLVTPDTFVSVAKQGASTWSA